jgi:hypothetical protein
LRWRRRIPGEAGSAGSRIDGSVASGFHSLSRYRGGIDTQLDALDAGRDLFQAELDLSQIRLNELLTVVQLYKALGRGQ